MAMILTTSFEQAAELWLTPVPGHTAPLPAQTGCATEQLLCELFFDAVSQAGHSPKPRRAALYGPWLRVTETRPPQLSCLDAGPCHFTGPNTSPHEGEPRWLRAGAFDRAG